MSNAIHPLHVGKFVPPPYAGIEAHVDTLLRALLPQVQGTLVACRTPTSQGDGLPYRLVAPKSYGTFASVALSPTLRSDILRELRERRCNLLHLHAPNPWGDIAALACSSDVPVVMTWHSDIVRQARLLRLYRPLQRRALERADRIVVFTPQHYASSEQLHQVDVESKITTIPIGIDFSRLDQPLSGDLARCPPVDEFARGRPVLLSVGRHVYYKGYRYLLDAVAQLDIDAVLVLIGTGPLTPELKQRAVELGIAERVLFLGEVDEPTLVAALHRSDVFCLPSIEPSEAFGIASAEAMACGKPTVVCELHNGVNFLNQNGVTSLTVTPRDVPALADAIRTLVKDDALRLAMGRRATEWVRSRFSIQAMRDQTIEMYRSLV